MGIIQTILKHTQCVGGGAQMVVECENRGVLVDLWVEYQTNLSQGHGVSFLFSILSYNPLSIQ